MQEPAAHTLFSWRPQGPVPVGHTPFSWGTGGAERDELYWRVAAGEGVAQQDWEREVPQRTAAKPRSPALPSVVTWTVQSAHVTLRSNLREVCLTGSQGGTVHIVGTAHVSTKSVEDVRRIIRALRPQVHRAVANAAPCALDRKLSAACRTATRLTESTQVVAVELCEARRAMLFPMPAQDLSLAGVVASLRDKNNNLFSTLYSYFLASVSDKLEVAPGIEFRAAYEEAKTLSPRALVKLIDRPVAITVARMWAALTTWDRIRIVWDMLRDICTLGDGQDLRQMIEDLKEHDAMTQVAVPLTIEYANLMRMDPTAPKRCTPWHKLL